MTKLLFFNIAFLMTFGLGTFWAFFRIPEIGVMFALLSVLIYLGRMSQE